MTIYNNTYDDFPNRKYKQEWSATDEINKQEQHISKLYEKNKEITICSIYEPEPNTIEDSIGMRN